MLRNQCLLALLSITSTIFRALSFIFLRVIPLPLFKTALPLLYLIYTALLLLTSDSALWATVKCRQHGNESAAKQRGGGNIKCSPNIFEPVWSFILTLPSASVNLRNLSILTNTALLFFAADFITHPIRYPAHEVAFARIGAVDHNNAKISLRYPQDDSAGKLGIKVIFRPLTSNTDRETGWLVGPSIEVSGENDWVASTTISNLFPSTVYEYKLAVSNSSFGLLYPAASHQFKTFPDPRLATGSHFNFIATSCILPNFPYVPGRGDQIKGFDMLAEYISAAGTTSKDAGGTSQSSHSGAMPHHHHDPRHSIVGPRYEANVSNASKTSLFDDTPSTEFLLFLGDFIYADVPIYYGDSAETYRRLYRRTYASPSFRKIYERLPSFHIYDDHEIINNFAGKANDSTYPFIHASSAFQLYHAQANYNSKRNGQYYYDFRYGDVAFFVLDTRRYRTDANVNHSTILGQQQIQDLKAWLAEVNQTSTFKFIVSSVPSTTLWQHDAQTDAWAAFRRERAELLEKLYSVPNVIILTGDRHEFAAIEYNGPFDCSHTIYEFSTSPLNMFYVPLIRTLNMESSQYVEKQERLKISDDGGWTFIKERHLVPDERVLKYLPVGNHKWASFEVDTRNASKPVISVRVMIDGQLAYSWRTIGVPLATRSSTGLSVALPQSLHGMLNKFGLGSRLWF